MAALAIGLGAIGELWVQDGLLLFLLLDYQFAGYDYILRIILNFKMLFMQMKAIDLACRFGYSIPNAYKSLGGALKELIEKTRKRKGVSLRMIRCLKKKCRKSKIRTISTRRF